MVWSKDTGCWQTSPTCKASKTFNNDKLCFLSGDSSKQREREAVVSGASSCRPPLWQRCHHHPYFSLGRCSKGSGWQAVPWAQLHHPKIWQPHQPTLWSQWWVSIWKVLCDTGFLRLWICIEQTGCQYFAIILHYYIFTVYVGHGGGE